MIFGILNLTEDSFSDGGKYLEPEQALRHASELRQRGADVLDLGPASSHPDSSRVTPEEEIRRIEPVIRELKTRNVPVSVDSYQPEVQRYALTQGVEYLNDIQGFPEPSIYGDLARGDCRLVVMHSIQASGPADRSDVPPGEILKRVREFFEERIARLTEAGIARERLILDPGMGFFLGTNAETSLTVLREIASLKKEFDLPVLISVSRKSFLGAVTERAVDERGAATLAAELFAAEQGVDYIRTHDAGALRDGLLIQERLNMVS